LGLERDRYDKYKWRGEGQIISINNQKFYDHLEQKGGYGAIDLVMHVQGRNFKEAVDWLSSGASSLPLPQQRSLQPKAPPEPQLFQPPVPDESKWQEVRQYLVDKRGLPAQMVDDLHSSGKVYAAGVDPEILEQLRKKDYSLPQRITNAVFLRRNEAGEATGASLRGVSDNSSFKGLATGSRRNDGWFSLTQGEGQLERIVLVESSIDALSAAALAKNKKSKTMFIATDGTGDIPATSLQQHQAAGVQIIVAHDADRAGEEMAWKVASEIPAVIRATPTRGKDWNEQLLGKDKSLPALEDWKQAAQAIGESETYLRWVAAHTKAAKAGQPLSEQALTAMQKSFNAYKQTSATLWQWHEAAKELGKSEADLKRIAEAAIAFHHPKAPTPLPEKAVENMQQMLKDYQQLNADTARTREIAQPLSEQLPNSPSLQQPTSYQSENEQLARQQEAWETAQAVRQLFTHLLRDIRLRQPDGSWVFSATNWRFNQKDDVVTITVKQDNRELLRVEGDKPVVFNPTPAEREKMKKFCQDVAQDLEEKWQKQQNAQPQQKSGQEPRQGRKQ
jgi:hypothetical protein